jgi:Flp pilus assembly protein TadG
VAHVDDRERGASLVEMAFVAPLLLLLLFGIVEFGYIFGQYNEVRHAAREGARVAAVSNTALDQDSDGDFDADDIEAYACSVLNLGSGNATITLTKSGSTIGSTATVTVAVLTPSLSGAPLISSFVPASVANAATFVLEQPSSWSVPGSAHTC